LVTVNLIGNTSNVTSAPAPFNQFLENPGTATINIAGVGTATFTDLVEILSTFNSPSPSPFNGQPTVIIATLDNPQGTSLTGVVFATNPAFLGYDLRTSIGPISGLGGDASGPNGVHHTTMGDLFFANGIGQAQTATFTSSTVPEPTSLMLFSVGLLGLSGLCLLRDRAATHTLE
jgi:hypothetical protein